MQCEINNYIHTMKENNVKIEKIPFKGYFENLTDEGKREFFFKVGPFASSSHIYACMRNDKFTARLRLAIETITEQKFEWNDKV